MEMWYNTNGTAMTKKPGDRMSQRVRGRCKRMTGVPAVSLPSRQYETARE